MVSMIPSVPAHDREKHQTRTQRLSYENGLQNYLDLWRDAPINIHFFNVITYNIMYNMCVYVLVYVYVCMDVLFILVYGESFFSVYL